MICDGIENCVRYIHNFSPEKSKNPLYFTQIIYYAFLRRIQQEKKQLEIKNKILERTDFDEVFDANDLDRDGNYSDYNSIKDGDYFENMKDVLNTQRNISSDEGCNHY